MENYLFREIKETSEDGLMTVSRQRHTRGSGSIIIKVKNTHADHSQTITLMSKSQTEDDIMTGEDPEDYEKRAVELAEMIMKVSKDSCELPGMASCERSEMDK